MEMRTLADCSMEELLSAFNQSFSDYFVPLQLTPEQLENKLRSENVDLAFSTGAFEHNKLCGFILHASDIIDDRRVVYNAGTGVIPTHRGQALTRRMYEFILPVLVKEKINSLVLEVINQNKAAIRSYEQVGFEVKRKLLCYKGEIKTSTGQAITIKPLGVYDWSLLKNFWDFPPTWQHSVNVLERSKKTTLSYGAYIEDRLVGYIVYNPLNKKVMQFATDPQFRRKKIASGLFCHVIPAATTVSVINVDESSAATNAFLIKNGLVNFIEQLEMEMQLTN